MKIEIDGIIFYEGHKGTNIICKDKTYEQLIAAYEKYKQLNKTKTDE
jgi:hypothetical protein